VYYVVNYLNTNSKEENEMENQPHHINIDTSEAERSHNIAVRVVEGAAVAGATAVSLAGMEGVAHADSSSSPVPGETTSPTPVETAIDDLSPAPSKKLLMTAASSPRHMKRPLMIQAYRPKRIKIPKPTRQQSIKRLSHSTLKPLLAKR
jgi:hypothetical protein